MVFTLHEGRFVDKLSFSCGKLAILMEGNRAEDK